MWEFAGTIWQGRRGNRLDPETGMTILRLEHQGFRVTVEDDPLGYININVYGYEEDDE